MTDKKTIKIDRNLLKSLLIGMLLGWLTVFVVEHFGKVSYVADTSGLPQTDGFSFSRRIPNDTPVSSIYLDTPFGSKIRISGRGYSVGDVWSSYGDFHKYSNKLNHYLGATFKDFKYVVYFGLGYALLVAIALKFKIRLT